MAVLTPSFRPWYRRRLPVLGVALATVLAIGGSYFAVAWVRRGAHEASVNKTLDKFRETAGASTAPAAPLLPATGVYTFHGSGREKLSLLSTAQAWGPNLPATVTRDGAGCWTMRIEFNTHHAQSWRYCVSGSTMREMGGTTDQEFDFVAFSAKDRSTFTCSTPGVVVRRGEAVGASSPIVCEGRSTNKTRSTSTGTIDFVGIERVVVGGETLDAYHVRSVRTMSQDQTGTDSTDSWFGVRDGMLLKFSRDLAVHSPSPVGSVTYREKGSFVLTSTTPRR